MLGFSTLRNGEVGLNFFLSLDLSTRKCHLTAIGLCGLAASLLWHIVGFSRGTFASFSPESMISFLAAFQWG